jgi:dTDP-4-dehydrorhamnose 3,5-epimerase
MIFTETPLKGAYLIDIKKLEDDRGFFGRSFCRNEFSEYGLDTEIVQCNISFNKKKGTLRGMHMQTSPFAESKLIRCTRGAIYDVIVDVREDSDTYTQWFGVELSEDSYRMLYIPKHFAHGFITLANNSEVEYQISEFFAPGSAIAFHWNDPTFNIKWPMQPEVISEKDKANPLFKAKEKS